MANLHHLITLGIGTPADVPHFLLVGLSVTAAAAPTSTEATLTLVDAMAVDAVAVDAEARTS